MTINICFRFPVWWGWRSSLDPHPGVDQELEDQAALADYHETPPSLGAPSWKDLHWQGPDGRVRNLEVSATWNPGWTFASTGKAYISKGNNLGSSIQQNSANLLWFLAQKHFSNKVQTPQSLYWTYIRKFTRCYRCEIKSFFHGIFSTLSWFGNTSQILGLLCGFGPTCGVSSTWETRTHPFGMTQMSSCSRYREFEFKRSLYLLYGAVCWLFTVYYA